MTMGGPVCPGKGCRTEDAHVHPLNKYLRSGPAGGQMGPKVPMGPPWLEKPLCPGGPGQLDTFAAALAKKGERRKSGFYSKSWGHVKLGEQQHPQRCCVRWWHCVTCF